MKQTTVPITPHYPTNLINHVPVFDSIEPNYAASHHADFYTNATNVFDPDTHLSNAQTPPTQCSDPKSMNPLPTSIKTPVNIKHFKKLLSHHPDRNMVSYLIAGLTQGFDIGFSGSLSLHNYKTRKPVIGT